MGVWNFTGKSHMWPTEPHTCPALLHCVCRNRMRRTLHTRAHRPAPGAAPSPCICSHMCPPCHMSHMLAHACVRTLCCPCPTQPEHCIRKTEPDRCPKMLPSQTPTVPSGRCQVGKGPEEICGAEPDPPATLSPAGSSQCARLHSSNLSAENWTVTASCSRR